MGGRKQDVPQPLGKVNIRNVFCLHLQYVLFKHLSFSLGIYKKKQKLSNVCVHLVVNVYRYLMFYLIPVCLSFSVQTDRNTLPKKSLE